MAVLDKQLSALEPLTQEELRHAIVVDASDREAVVGLVSRVRANLGQAANQVSAPQTVEFSPPKWVWE